MPPGVDEYTSGIWEGSVSRTFLDGMAWACEHACRAIGLADMILVGYLDTISH